MNELKPCPFCGSEAHIEKGTLRIKNNKVRRLKKQKSYYIGCSDPDCILYSTERTGKLFFTTSQDGIGTMIRMWNRRAGE